MIAPLVFTTRPGASRCSAIAGQANYDVKEGLGLVVIDQGEIHPEKIQQE